MRKCTADTRTGAPCESRKLPTSKDVARRAGVSQSSVCRTFSEKWNGKLSEEIRTKVLSAAKELGYNPNAIARSLTVKRSGIIGVILSDEFNEFYYDMLCRFTNLIQQHGMRVMVLNSRVFSDVNSVIALLQEYRVDGIIVSAAARGNGVPEQWGQWGLPIVLVNIYDKELPLTSVCSDNYSGAFELASDLCSRGCKSFGIITAQKSKYQDVPERVQGFTDGLHASGITDYTVKHCDYTYLRAKDVARSLLRKNPEIDMVYCVGARIALAVMDVARDEFGLRVPQDISVVGYGDLPCAAELDCYRLTTLDQPSELIVQAAVNSLLEQIETGVCTPQRILLPLMLNERGSVRSVAKTVRPTFSALLKAFAK